MTIDLGNITLEILRKSIMITAFVLMMMLIIEYLNVRTKNVWSRSLQHKPFWQIIIAAILGITPGCLGAYTVVSLYTHRIVNLAALITVMIATSGDEAFIMFSMIPQTAVWIHILLFGIAIISGILISVLIKQQNFKKDKSFPFHSQQPNECVSFNKNLFLTQLRHFTLKRFLIIFLSFIFLVFLFIHHHHSHTWDWKYWIFFVSILLTISIAITVPNHFIEKHIWQHIVRHHLLRIFAWTFFTLLTFAILSNYFDIHQWIENNRWELLLLAVLIGIIPESGPHMIFITLFASGTLPFSILLASSISQDGHGMLPLLAESKKDFLIVKTINIIIAFIVGSIGLYF